MRVLVLAPHPFYQERGTPIAVDLLLRALSERGDEIDLLTYHEGEDRTYDRVRIHRIRPRVRIHDVRPGPSWKKLVCDFHMMGALMKLVRRNSFDIVHAIEESAFMAMAVARMKSMPFVYDMDSSMVTQIVDKYAWLRPFDRVLRFLESLPMRRARAVVPVCDALAQQVLDYRTDGVRVLKDISLLDKHRSDEEVDSIRDRLGVSGSIVMYIGNLEPYQGIDLLMHSFALVHASVPDAHLVVIGGADVDIRKYEDLSRSLGLESHAHFLGRRPVSHIGSYMAQADVLASPRTQGVNTPMKVYTYLDSGTAVVATDLPTHTQVMTDRIAMLAAAEKEAFASAMVALLRDPERRRQLAANARRYIQQEHSYEAFRRTVHELYDGFEKEMAEEGSPPGEPGKP